MEKIIIKNKKTGRERPISKHAFENLMPTSHDWEIKKELKELKPKGNQTSITNINGDEGKK